MATPDDYRSIFSSPEGKRVLEQLKQKSCHGSPSFVVGLESWQPAFRDGAKAMIQYILDKIEEQSPTTTPGPTTIKP